MIVLTTTVPHRVKWIDSPHVMEGFLRLYKAAIASPTAPPLPPLVVMSNFYPLRIRATGNRGSKPPYSRGVA